MGVLFMLLYCYTLPPFLPFLPSFALIYLASIPFDGIIFPFLLCGYLALCFGLHFVIHWSFLEHINGLDWTKV